MKIYRVDFHDASEGCIVSWHTNKRDADTDLRNKQREARSLGREPQGPECVTEVHIIPTRLMLVDWLNRNLHHDNG